MNELPATQSLRCKLKLLLTKEQEEAVRSTALAFRNPPESRIHCCFCGREDIARHETAKTGVPGFAQEVRAASLNGMQRAQASGFGLQNPLGTRQSGRGP
ncbi:hypothetical protein A7Q09_03010 [Methylacidiphilum sp. Yel]|nr:hypothetical protein A7Q09_03010 [Methylacidiphilum sp. Yel]